MGGRHATCATRATCKGATATAAAASCTACTALHLDRGVLTIILLGSSVRQRLQRCTAVCGGVPQQYRQVAASVGARVPAAPIRRHLPVLVFSAQTNCSSCSSCSIKTSTRSIVICIQRMQMRGKCSCSVAAARYVCLAGDYWRRP